ncbi:MAG TPA: ATP-binding protein [Kofleriaceae bacterium]|jgi:signal transduction histidine kinase|nr:ATP-binding protein [Kofleriaceae bacterium]
MDAQDPNERPLVLYVDDERPNRIVFEQSLKSEFRIKTVADGNAALATLASEDVAVLVSDIRMPEIDGLELLRIAKDKHPHTLRMVITAYSDFDPILRAINEGLVARYIVKPWNREELKLVLRWATEVWTFGRDRLELMERLLQTERLASLGGIAAAYTHDLRTPLMMVDVTLDQLREVAEAVPALHAAIESTSLDAATKRQLLDQIDMAPELIADTKKASEDLKGIIALFNEFIKPGSKRGVPPVIDPLPIVRHVVLMNQKIGGAKTPIGYVGPDHLPHIRMMPVELTQVLLNIIGNARQAVEARGEPNRGVAVNASIQGNMLELKVRDEGVGMPPEVLKKVGTPWFTTRKEGTGLGLSNVQRLVGVAGGRLRIESEPGVGTVVTILLPTAA